MEVRMQERDIKMDIFKGLLVIGMVYCHILQFFVNLGKNPVADHITGYINSVTFAGFVFTFGYTSYIAYFSKPFKEVYRRIIMAFLKLLCAYYISGLSFRVFVDHKHISWILVKKILMLQDIPGWSEFIISFALYILVAVILFYPLKKLIEIKPLFWVIVPLLLFTTLLLYDHVNSTQLGLLIGTTKFAAFPILQYMPLYLLGIYFKRYEIGPNKFVILGAGTLSGIGLVQMSFNNWQLPGRFPPTVFWIILPSFALCMYYGMGFLLQKYKIRCGILLILGQNSMVYLLLSNMIIFALSGVRGVKTLGSVTGFIGNIFLLGFITYLIQMSRPLPKKKFLGIAGLSILVFSLLLGGCQMKDKKIEELSLTINPDQFYNNPLGISQIGDPFVLKASDGKYYCYPTSDPNNGYKVWVSEDMVNWEKQIEKVYTKEPNTWCKGDFWAPEVYEWEGKFYMYYTAKWKETNTLRIGVAISDSPLGPFKDTNNAPMFDFGYATIDANIFIDEDGQGYLYYSRDCSENKIGDLNESHIYGIQLSEDRLSVVGEPVLLAQPDQGWELNSGSFRWNEGPYVFKREGIYYLMYSGHYYADRRYSLGYATSVDPLGTYVKYEKNPILYTQTDWPKISGPGHHNITTSPEGNFWYVAYHTHTVPAIGGGDRQVNIDRMGFREDGSIYINGPTLTSQLKPAIMDRVVDVMSSVEIYRNGEKTSLLEDGEFSIYTEGKVKTPVVALKETDVIELKFNKEQTVQGMLLYDGSLEGERLEKVTIEFSNGYQISELALPKEAGAPAIAQFSPMQVKWIKIYNRSPEGKSGALSEIIVQ